MKKLGKHSWIPTKDTFNVFEYMTGIDILNRRKYKIISNKWQYGLY